MIVLAVALIALSILFLLTSLGGRLRHPFLVVLALIGTLVLGLAFAMD